MKKKHILLLCGGGGTEHAVSLVSAGHIKEKLSLMTSYEVKTIEIKKNGDWVNNEGSTFQLMQGQKGESFLLENISKQSWPVDFVVPCIHGPPGETGDIQSYLDILRLPYLGCRPEASRLCFNKISSKLWFSALNIPNTPYLFLSNPDSLENELVRVKKMFEKEGKLFVKASSQGSSIGAFPLDNINDCEKIIKEAFTLSPYVLVEKKVIPRELEVAAYEYQGQLIITPPSEIICGGGFYSFEEKYDKKSKATTDIVAQNLPEPIGQQIQKYAREAFLGLKLKHLSRIDFFYTDKGELYLNEINTFPGMTPISMFPKMMENNGHKFQDFLENVIANELEGKNQKLRQQL